MDDIYMPDSLDRYQLPWPQREDRWQPHLPLLYDLVTAVHPKLVVDLTLGDGEQACFALCQAMKDSRVDGLLYAFGKPQDPHTNNRYNRDHYAGFSYQMDSAPDKPEERFGLGSIELLHIDCQKETNAMETLSAWLPLMAPAGFLVFHGVNAEPTLWQDVERHGQSFLFPAGEGLGIVRLPAGSDPATAGHTALLVLLTDGDADEAEQLRRLYQHVAEHVVLKSADR